ncbi:MAG: type I restriction-modification enzyme R subunit C-terminal domain-containing protein [Dehalococcoidia bacterium]|nr:type I restriction-modification enzyme R subunit C-terminal domain-containing protein [Dehalococcoidia bacterium]
MSDQNERKTRRELIDPALKKAGWEIEAFDPRKPLSDCDRCAVTEYPTDNGPADYALCVGGKILGIVEAKKVTLGPQNVLTQAERYSKGATASSLNFNGYRVPFIYSTNGEVIWHDDVRSPSHRSRKVAHFHTPEALTERMEQDFDAACARLQRTPNAHERLRPYQIEANQAIEKAIAERKRQMLVAMATGTGKTFTMVNEVYRLMKSGVARRILFLVDRRALAAQAVRAFASFEPEPNKKFDKIYEVYSQRFRREDLDDAQKFDPKVLPTSYLTDPQPKLAFVYVCTIQRMTINLFGRQAIFALGDEAVDEDADQLEIPIHAFDLIIADECHRGYTSAESAIWRKTLDHFDAIKVGLTATPAAHTSAYFNEVVYRYEYERAVREGFLVDYDVVKLHSDVRMNGIFLKEGEEVGMIDPESGAETMDRLEDQREFLAAEVEEKVTSPQSNRMILEEIRKYALEHEKRYGRFPKTLIFAANDVPHTSHADQLVNTARDVFGQGDSFVQKITGSPTVDRPLQRIREFRNRKLPAIAVTVDMLSTGVDIPDLEYIVFLRTVKSRILFEQMMGRGTRKGENYPDKSHFVVFDCFDGTLLEYFKQATAITAEPPEREPRSIAQVIDDIWQNRDRDYNIRCLVKRLHRIDKEMSGEAREMFAAYIPGGDIGGLARELPRRLREDFANTMAFLRDKGFQDLLLTYPRKPKTFVVAYETTDNVSSSWLIRDGKGHEYKPEDYLSAFARFVRENRDQIRAIGILLNRPKDWSTDALDELRRKLAGAPERYTLENLQRAHELQYHKALVDIISMVKHAAREQEPLFTADERVKLAFVKVTSGRTFSAEQRKWLDRIRDHLVENLSIDREDFDTIPIFTLSGGWGKANKVFENQLEPLLKDLNEAIAL